MEKIYRIKDIAEQLGISRRKVSVLIRSGYLKAINTNRGGKKPVYRIMADDMAEYIITNKIKI